MASKEMTSGKFLAELRESKDVTLRELARKMKVSAPFLSDVEKDRRSALTSERIEQVAETLNLKADDKKKLYDLAGEQRNTIAPDLPDYIMGKEYVVVALRTSRDLGIGREKWLKFIKEMKKGKD
ncbi:MAG: helix-turn-helix domain-containing protein [Phascolarctobacterium sp.]|nr:helix-turn-helix domain-containing protein [Phascolarctobacterium sp.]